MQSRARAPPSLVRALDASLTKGETEVTLRIQGVAAAAALMLLSIPAIAQTPFTQDKVTASGRVMYGLNLQAGSLNPYALGLGARGGYTMSNNIYAGGSLDVFFGTSKSVLGNTIDSSHWQIMGEGGYDLALGQDALVLRPLGTLGLSQHAVGYCFEETGDCGHNRNTAIVFGFGANLMYNLGSFYAGGDVRFNWLLADVDENTSIILGGLAGMTF